MSLNGKLCVCYSDVFILYDVFPCCWWMFVICWLDGVLFVDVMLVGCCVINVWCFELSRCVHVASPVVCVLSLFRFPMSG